MVDYVKASKRAKSMGIDISPSVLKKLLTTPKSKQQMLSEAIQELKTNARKAAQKNPSKRAKGGAITKKKK